MTGSQRIIKDSNVTFLSPVLDKMVDEFFHSAANMVKYLSGSREPTAEEHAKFDAEATRLFDLYQARKVRDLTGSKRDLELLAAYAARQNDPPKVASQEALMTRIESDKDTLAGLDRKMTEIKAQMKSESGPAYNALVDSHNLIVGEYQRTQIQLNLNIGAYNALDVKILSIVEIGGGIDLEPSKFAIRTSPSSERLAEFKGHIAGLEEQGAEKASAAKWISSEATNSKPAVQTPLVGRDFWQCVSLKTCRHSERSLWRLCDKGGVKNR